MGNELIEAVRLSNAAKAKGYAVAVLGGRVQFQTVEFDSAGASTVTPRTGWLTYNEALEIINSDNIGA